MSALKLKAILPRLDAIKALAEKATPGPWVAGEPAWFRGRQDPQAGKRPISAGAQGVLANVYGEGNATMIAAARNDLPALVEALEEARELLTETLAMIEASPVCRSKEPGCGVCMLKAAIREALGQ